MPGTLKWISITLSISPILTKKGSITAQFYQRKLDFSNRRARLLGKHKYDVGDSCFRKGADPLKVKTNISAFNEDKRLFGADKIGLRL